MVEVEQRKPTSRLEPENKNLRYANRAALHFHRLPHVNYFSSSFTMPSLSVNYIPVSTPFRKVPHAGTELQYDQNFTINFSVDEDLENYKEILNWMMGIGFPDDFDQYSNLVQGKDEGDIFSDVTAIIYTNNMAVLTEITYEDVIPIFLDSLTFGNDLDQPIFASATFAYSKFDFIKRRHLA